MDSDVTPGFSQRLAKWIVDWFDARQLVTWERHDQNARLLMITNVWPYDEQPAYGPYVRDIADELCRQDLISDVLFIRGYRTPLAYMAGALTCLLLPLAHPNKYLLVHSHGGETSLAARFYPDGPVLASYLGTDILGTQVGGGLRLRTKCRLRSLVLRAHAATMSATTTKSLEMQTLLVSRARSRNTVIPDGIDRERFYPRDRAQARAELDWPNDRTIVLFAGRAQAPEKRLWLARSVIDIARAQIPDIQLQIDEVVPPSQMPLHYAAADCLLHTSVSEGSPCVVKEALACDLPVVATPSGDVRDLLVGVNACEVCEAEPDMLADALIRVLRLGQSNGRALTEHLSLEATTQRTIECYRALGFPVSKCSDGQVIDKASLAGPAQ